MKNIVFRLIVIQLKCMLKITKFRRNVKYKNQSKEILMIHFVAIQGEKYFFELDYMLTTAESIK